MEGVGQFGQIRIDKTNNGIMDCSPVFGRFFGNDFGVECCVF